MRSALPAVALALAAALAAAAGCGGGDPDGGARLEAEAAGDESSAESPTTTAETGPAAGRPPSGEDVYRRNCASCHGETGGGGFGPSMAGVADRLALDDHVAVVRDGRGRMPAWGSSLDPEEIEAVVDYQRAALSEPSS